MRTERYSDSGSTPSTDAGHWEIKTEWRQNDHGYWIAWNVGHWVGMLRVSEPIGSAGYLFYMRNDGVNDRGLGQ